MYNTTKKDKQKYRLLKSKQQFSDFELKQYIDPYIEILERNQNAMRERLEELVFLHTEQLKKIKGSRQMNSEQKYAALADMYA